MSLAAVTDAELEVRAKKGDKAAYAELVKRGCEYSKTQYAEAAKGRNRYKPEPRY